MEKSFFVVFAEWLRQWFASLNFSPAAVEVLMDVVGGLGVIIFCLLNALVLVYLERKVSSFIQQRYGPNRLGPKGLFQTLADTLKLLTKEDIIPEAVDKWVFRIASLLIFVPATMVFAVIPFGDKMIIADLNIGLFYFVSVASVSTIAFLMAGWGSNNKYSLLGGMRSVAQMVSYEIPLVFSLVGVVMLTGSLKMSDIVAAQKNMWFIVPQFIGFFIYFIAGTAELNRAPFDLPEGEQELVAGLYTEYSGMRWALFFLAEYANLVAVSSIATTLFLGGWQAPFDFLNFIPSYVWFILKVYFMILLFMWTRWTLPRIRIDHLMSFSWKVLIPLSLANILVTGVGIKLFQWMGW
ncbi:NADH-quinone oxidoreductase subunit NuoH [Carboxydocella sp. JDF658]|uniref:NADH-quinone oxidoreductase subunit NuoH n=1 Tax=Carboxydocella sp. JDF658 TaxID=1926600 RepID=UPI0009AE059B|nr:NADH-quinone oxidoreductase subunit NuoH [Carboxydocella sp. JDF658]GAW31430.1 NADH:ubiquinone oxidoreductase subunit H [Carboxydocella sp. JDF658]